MSTTVADYIEGADLLDAIQSGCDLSPSGYPCIDSGEVVSDSFDPSEWYDEAVVQGVDASSMSAAFVIVTRGKSINRNGHMVQIAPDKDAEGIKLDNYRTNPVVLFDHGFGFPMPIGISEDPKGRNTVKLMKNKATAVAYFSQRLPEAVQVFALIDEGILRTSSISFLPERGRLIKQQSAERDGEVSFEPWQSFDFIESDLLEWSVVGIPADPGAVRKCLDRGQINGERITAPLRQSLVRMAGEAPVWSPGANLGTVDEPETVVTPEPSWQQSVASELRAERIRRRVSDAVRDGVRQACGGRHQGDDSEGDAGSAQDG